MVLSTRRICYNLLRSPFSEMSEGGPTGRAPEPHRCQGLRAGTNQDLRMVQNWRSLPTSRSISFDFINCILFSSCKSQFLPQSQVTKKENSARRGERRETPSIPWCSQCLPPSVMEVVSRTSPRESSFLDGAEILLKMPHSHEEGDAAEHKTYRSVRTSKRGIERKVLEFLSKM